MLRSTTSAFTRVFDALWRCAADLGPIVAVPQVWVPALRCTARALHRVRDTNPEAHTHSVVITRHRVGALRRPMTGSSG
jgi:hypothetical protein